jgi:adenine-specific DNA methylase
LSKRTRNKVHEDPGQAFYIAVDKMSGTFSVVVHDGPPREAPTLRAATTPDGKKQKGKSACCPFCKHVHPLQVHQRLASEGHSEDALLVVADLDEDRGKVFRLPENEDLDAVTAARKELVRETDFALGLSARPDEEIPENNGATIRPQLYGARTYGDLMGDRQTLSYVRLCRIINNLDGELQSAGISPDYRRALSGYASANLVRMLKTATRGARLYPNARPGSNRVYVDHIYTNESTISFNHDFFEVGIGDGPGSWGALSANTITNLAAIMEGIRGVPCSVMRGSATSLAYRSGTIDSVVTDPPYDSMVYYSDASDLLYVWLKRALATVDPSLALAAGASGAQDKCDEIIVKEHSKSSTEHRTREHYDSKIAMAFAEMRRVVRDDGVVTIVFGHGEPEVWQRFLSSIQRAGLVMTGSWPANTEAGGQQGKANIETTLTMACRPAPSNRLIGRKGAVEAEIKAEIKQRYPDWERWGLAPADMLMAAAGPAMEVVGRYREVRDKNGNPVDIHTFLPLARAAVQDAMAVEIDHHPLTAFDARTRFALWWVRLYGRQVQAKSELRWQTLASSLDIDDVRDLVPDADKGVRFTTAQQFKGRITAESAVIDVALALAAASDQGLAAMADVLAASGHVADDAYLWAAVQFLARRLPEHDPDSVAFARVLRTRTSIANVAETAITSYEQQRQRQEDEDAQMRLL